MRQYAVRVAYFEPVVAPLLVSKLLESLPEGALPRARQQVDVTTRKDTLDYSLAHLLVIAYGRGVGDAATTIEESQHLA
jgi:hypothetical protein